MKGLQSLSGKNKGVAHVGEQMTERERGVKWHRHNVLGKR